MTLQELIDQRASVWAQMTTIIETNDWTGEQRQTYDRLEAEFDKLDGDIERSQRHAARVAENTVDRSGVTPPVSSQERELDGDQSYRNAFESYVLRGMAELDSAERSTLRAGFVGQNPRNAAGIGTTTAGGYLVPPEFRQNIVERMKAYGAVQAVAQVINTDTGATLPWPTNDDTGNMGALLAENTQATEQDMVFGTAQVGAYEYHSKIVRVSLEFLQDVAWLDAEKLLRRKFAERLGRIHNVHFTTGTGTNQPQGIVTGASAGATAAAAAAVTADELIDLQHSIDPAYRNERARFMLSDTALKGVRKLKATGTGEYLFQVSTSADMPNLLAGSPYVVNQDMAVPATGVKSILYGDFETGYLIRLVKAFELIRLDERYADYGQVGFIAFDRADGVVQDANAYKALVQA